jgi:hypothetical protein
LLHVLLGELAHFGRNIEHLVVWHGFPFSPVFLASRPLSQRR